MRTVAWLLLGFLPFSSSLIAQQAATAAPVAPGVISTTQQRVDPTMSYHRVLAIVPLVGSGTAGDPVRPMFAPVPQSSTPNNPFGSPQTNTQNNQQSNPQNTQASGTQSNPVSSPPSPSIIAYQHQLSDDGTLSLVEFVATDRSAFAALFASTDARVQYFEVGKSTQAEIQAAFQQKKAGFNAATFLPMPVH
jgi:hypothetical protein